MVSNTPRHEVSRLIWISQWRAGIPIPPTTILEESEENFEGEDKKAFLQFMRKMLQWVPEERQTAKQLLGDPWMNG
jgi:serine/threonine-protein kinase SRPK3